MKKLFYVCAIFSLAIFTSACSMNLSGPQGPDSGDEVEIPGGPDSGDEIDTDNPQGPDSGDEIDPNEPQGPDSGDEEAVEPEPTSPDSGDEIDLSEEKDDDNSDDDQPTSPDSGDEIDTSEDEEDENDDDGAFGGKGSCDSIDDNSTCVTYVGSYWNDKNMKLHCSEVGVFSKKSCPIDSLGGCKVGVGTKSENIIWHYGRGGDPFTEVIGYSAKACTAIPGTAWVTR